MFATVTLNPALDKNICVERLEVGDTNRILKIETDAGGKGINAARMLKELGADVVALGFLGGKTGRFINHVLKEEGVGTGFVHLRGETRTNLAIQEAGGAPPTTLNDQGPEVGPQEVEELTDLVRNVACSCQMVLLGGSLPPGVPADIYRVLGELVGEAGAKVVLDADGPPMIEGLKSRPYMIKPNLDEVERLLDRPVRTEAEAAAAARGLTANAEVAVVSMGKRGAIAARGDEVWKAVAPEVEVVSTIGSGDSMLAAMMLRLEETSDLKEALVWGCAAGAATAMSSGADIGRREDVMALLDKVRVERAA